MAKLSAIIKNEKRKRLVERCAAKRSELKAIIKDPKTPSGTRMEAMERLNKLPLDSNPIRVRNRCMLSGRPRGYEGKFGLSRIALRDLARRGELPGVTKSSW